jgi:adenylate cyclase
MFKNQFIILGGLCLLKKLLTAIALAWVMVIIWYTDAFYFIDNPLTDKITNKPRPTNPDIKIITVDSTSLNKMDLESWSRSQMAELVDKVATAGAKAIWINDLYTSESTIPTEDQALAEVIAKHANIYLPVKVNFDVIGQPTRVLEREYLKYPVFDLPSERIGHINIMKDRDGVVRKILLGVPTLDDEIVPLIGVRLANLLLPEDSQITWNKSFIWSRGLERIQLDKNLQVGFSYSSSAKSKFDTIPAWSVMSDETDPSYFRNSLVLIETYDDVRNLYKTPVVEQMSETEVQANIIQAIIEGRFYTEISDSLAITIVVLAAMLSFYLFDALRLKLGIILLIILLALNTGAVVYFYNNKAILLPNFATALAFILAFVAVILYNKVINKQKN